MRNEIFFDSLGGFLSFFVQLSTLNEKKILFENTLEKIPSLIERMDSPEKIDQQLHTDIKAEKAFFLEVRDYIFTCFIQNQDRLCRAFFAALFLIKDNYPGGQQEKIRNLIYKDRSVSESELTAGFSFILGFKRAKRCVI